MTTISCHAIENLDTKGRDFVREENSFGLSNRRFQLELKVCRRHLHFLTFTFAVIALLWLHSIRL